SPNPPSESTVTVGSAANGSEADPDVAESAPTLPVAADFPRPPAASSLVFPADCSPAPGPFSESTVDWFFARDAVVPVSVGPAASSLPVFAPALTGKPAT